MSSDFKVKVNETFEFDFNTENTSKLDAVSVERNKFHILQNNLPFITEIIYSNFYKKKYTVKVNNNIYQVAISNPLDILLQEMGFEVGVSKVIKQLKAPMPGLILEINVEVGQTVLENDNLLILTAMKMENSLLSPRDGVIKSIVINVGDSVIKGDLLIEFE
ncbi:acetyl-CoA carboxylase biotin carboxyl carrier protein subunit [Flavobacterium franklandianum]|uniref:Acetyl-CoA carboxylase biotin carboxyl carrier protein subunit n=1 Tax=Flavobacterium franklandianum TaxID=2594430 RepID=A0A553C6E1_9FLAO|nr:acetyl-CoA carboxylase biotin carboxyl carrier protein subunit [Flavobacterium franklandianum]TRX16090.1 acetyl-CoA carboxylase biotin carboxyl carrier protein subunit [Flavobacterium franklandianum]